MRRSRALAFLALVGVASAACEKAADDESKAEKAQAVASDKLTAATVEANQKMAAAQAEADRKIAEAQASFMKLRENYRHDVTLDLASIDDKIAHLSANERTATGKARADIDARLAEIRTSRTALDNDFDQLQAASAVTWDDAKARFENDMNALSALLDHH